LVCFGFISYCRNLYRLSVTLTFDLTYRRVSIFL
jgi:hypothetical protein